MEGLKSDIADSIHVSDSRKTADGNESRVTLIEQKPRWSVSMPYALMATHKTFSLKWDRFIKMAS